VSGRGHGPGGSAGAPRYRPDWLDLREPADAAARAVALLDPLRRLLPGARPLEVWDLGCGTGAMGRWLAPRLTGRQHWIMVDQDAALLAGAEAGMVTAAADGAPVTVATRHRDLAALPAADLSGAGLVTASALLDVLSEREMERLATMCVQAGCPALLTLTVTGQVELSPPDPLDPEITAAFNAHQRRQAAGQRRLGPDAVGAAAEAFTRRGAAVEVHPSPWRLGPGRSALLGGWLRGWVAAAYEQRPDLPAAAYLRRRSAAAAAGELHAVVGHRDLLAA
jgi:hypothetical protein